MKQSDIADLNARLSPEEYRVIVEKGTEPPFSGRYAHHTADGVYQCRRCGAPLYSADNKFSSHCGWPSFDDNIRGAVRRLPDPDGCRTEIVCASCGGHLGHVFEGEGFTRKNVRHCVNSLSLQFVERKRAVTNEVERAIFAGGCFWGVEHLLRQERGVLDITSGYTDGSTENPTYEQVCAGIGGHAEAVEVRFDPAQVSYERLARLFFEIHDPTQHNRQGPDVGAQYRSGVYYTSEEQHETALRLIQRLKNNGFDVVTEVKPARAFWPAEPYHQRYYSRTGREPYCHIRVVRFDT